MLKLKNPIVNNVGTPSLPFKIAFIRSQNLNTESTRRTKSGSPTGHLCAAYSTSYPFGVAFNQIVM